MRPVGSYRNLWSKVKRVTAAVAAERSPCGPIPRQKSRYAGTVIFRVWILTENTDTWHTKLTKGMVMSNGEISFRRKSRFLSHAA
jgi:hypothetical protein